MADLKISQMTAATTPLVGTELVPLVQSGGNVKVTVANLTAGRAVSAASLTLTTTPLAAASGGTGLTALGTGVATALGQNVSGSGSIALTTSPVFVTPTLGVAGATTLTLTGGTVTASTPVIDATQTWNAGGVAFTGWKLNVTNTASAAASKLLDLQVNGSSLVYIGKAGAVSAFVYGVGASGYGSIKFGGLDGSNTLAQIADGGLISVRSGGYYGWSGDANDAGAARDLYLYRDAANTLAQRNGVNAQTFNVYNTYTDGSNYERLTLLWSSNAARLLTEAAGTGSARAMVIGTAGAALLQFRTTNTARWVVDANGHFIADTTNTYDIGASAGNKPRNGFFAGTLSFGTHSAIAAETVTGYITITDAGGTTRKLAVVS